MILHFLIMCPEEAQQFQHPDKRKVSASAAGWSVLNVTNNVLRVDVIIRVESSKAESNSTRASRPVNQRVVAQAFCPCQFSFYQASLLNTCNRSHRNAIKGRQEEMLKESNEIWGTQLCLNSQATVAVLLFLF